MKNEKCKFCSEYHIPKKDDINKYYKRIQFLEKQIEGIKGNKDLLEIIVKHSQNLDDKEREELLEYLDSYGDPKK